MRLVQLEPPPSKKKKITQLFFLKKTIVEADLRDIAVGFQTSAINKYHNKASHPIFWFLAAHKCHVYTIL